MRGENESDEEFAAKRAAYVENIRSMIFADLPEIRYDLYVKEGVTEESLSFYLVPHLSQRPITDLMDPAFVSLSSLREQIDEYGLQQENVQVIVWQSPVSSSFGEYWGRKPGETDIQWLARQEMVMDHIYSMVFHTAE